MIRKFLKSIQKNSVMVVGDIMLDRYLFGEISKKSDEAPIDIVKINKTSEKLGGAANVALSLQKLNTNVLLFGFVGNDFYGEEIISIMKKNKMNTTGIIKQHKTTIKNRIVISSQTQFARFDSEKIQYQTNKNKEKSNYCSWKLISTFYVGSIFFCSSLLCFPLVCFSRSESRPE